VDAEDGDYVGRGCKVTSPNGNNLAFSLLNRHVMLLITFLDLDIV